MYCVERTYGTLDHELDHGILRLPPLDNLSVHRCPMFCSVGPWISASCETYGQYPTVQSEIRSAGAGGGSETTVALQRKKSLHGTRNGSQSRAADNVQEWSGERSPRNPADFRMKEGGTSMSSSMNTTFSDIARQEGDPPMSTHESTTTTQDHVTSTRKQPHKGWRIVVILPWM